MKKIRLDKLLVEKGVVESRERAMALILGGNVLVDEIKVNKAGILVNPDASLKLLQGIPYVSRGGLKLETALKSFNINVDGKIAMDVGASTGGFTDCLLQHGAKRVYAIDVGYGQLDWKLRKDTRVVSLERTNIRYLDEIVRSQKTSANSVKPSKVKSQELEDLIKSNIDIATVDVSFISLLKVIPKIIEFLKKKGEIVALIKPQFEIGRKDVEKGGVVKDEDRRLEAVERIKKAAKATANSSTLVKTITSPTEKRRYRRNSPFAAISIRSLY